MVELIGASRSRAYLAVNQELIDLYWAIGKHISQKIETEGWGKGTVLQLAAYIHKKQPGLSGFSHQNLWRMRQFFETYRADAKLSPLVRVLPWTHNLLILSRSRRAEEREFYIRAALRERWGKRELERQLNSGLFERTVLSPAKLSPAVRVLHPDAATIFKDAYCLEFLRLPPDHSEKDLHRALVDRLKHFIIELGSDFCFIGSYYPLQVGKKDYELDLLFFHRGLN